jgi:hypothetical protein
VLLYTCPGRHHGASTPLVKHPCGLAAKALDDAGHHYEVEVVGGFKHLPLSRRGRRDKIVELTGQEDVPVLVADDGSVIAGWREIVVWAQTHPARG